ncbi:MAG: SGNH/GDSL hydrolase family protein [Spirochaetia bacterium]|nr:SGNH/GDSL hydrolase family protein [Spirochaetia bacterium]
MHPTKYYLALGDSYTVGEGVEPGARFPAQLAKRLAASNIQISSPYLIARTGWTGQDLLSAYAAESFDQPYDLVTLAIGVNNQYQGQHPALFRIELKYLLQAAIKSAQGRPGRVIVLSIPDWGMSPFAKNRDREKIAKEIDLYNEALAAECRNAKVVYLDITKITRKLSADSDAFAPDGLHFTAKVYRAWAELLFPLALGILKSDTP